MIIDLMFQLLLFFFSFSFSFLSFTFTLSRIHRGTKKTFVSSENENNFFFCNEMKIKYWMNHFSVDVLWFFAAKVNKYFNSNIDRTDDTCFDYISISFLKVAHMYPCLNAKWICRKKNLQQQWNTKLI